MKLIYSHILAALAGGGIVFFSTTLYRRPVAQEYGPQFPAHMSLSPAEKNALMGDKNSSTILTRATNDCATLEQFGRKDGDKCRSNQYFWQMIDAENGGSDGMSALEISFSASSDCVYKLRAIFWLSRLQQLDPGNGSNRSERERAIKGTSGC